MAEPVPSPVLSVRAVSRRFAGVQALSEVSLDFAAGQIYAVLGENGAGKSTLMNVLNGALAPDHGEIVLDGQPVRLTSPRQARAHGIGMVHQHFTLVDALTVGENMALTFSAPGSLRFDADSVAAAAREFADSIGLELAPAGARVADLPVGTRQRMEILRALAGSVRILILDEPTAVLTPQETGQLFAILRKLRERGCTVLFITHKLGEALAIADHIALLRQGRVVGTFRADEVDETELARRMIGDAHPELPERRRAPGSEVPEPRPLLKVTGLTHYAADRRPLLENVDFEVAHGEILGIAGVDGNGQAELFEVLVGLTRASAGSISVNGRPLPELSPQAALAAGIGHIPPDRHRNGLILGMSVLDNCLLARQLLDRFSFCGLLDYRKARDFAASIVRDYSVRLGSIDDPVRTLSGGNQQRVIIGRELALMPEILVTVSPTRGLDLSAARGVGEALLAAAQRGCAVVLISTDLDEILSLSDRVRVLYRGRLSRPLTPPIDVAQLGLLMAGADA